MRTFHLLCAAVCLLVATIAIFMGDEGGAAVLIGLAIIAKMDAAA